MEPKYYHHLVGGNFRLDALQAAVLRVKLPHLAGVDATARRANAARYRALFADAGLDEVVTLPVEAPDRTHIYNQFVIRVPRSRSRCNAHLDAAGIGTEVYYPVPFHLQECFADLGYPPGAFPEAEAAAATSLALPIYPELTDAQQATVVDAIRPLSTADNVHGPVEADRIEARRRCGVIGLGYVGLPLAVEFARAGFDVVGFDVDAEQGRRAQRPAAATSRTCRPSTSPKWSRAASSCATTDPTSLADVDIIDICVPTPLRKTRDPDLSYVVQAVETTAAVLRKGQLIILESTTYPGTTDEVVQPVLEAKGFKAGRGFLSGVLARARRSGQSDLPDQEHPQGRRRHQRGQHRAPRWRSTRQVIDTVVPVSSTRVAEMVKLLENTFRAVNIGLVNELALMCHRMDIDVWEVIDAAKTKPFGFMPFYPGPGPGRPLHPDRSVLPVVEGASRATSRRASSSSPATSTARCPSIVVERIAEALNSHAKRSTARACTCSASPTSATSTTCASRRRSTSWSC